VGADVGIPQHCAPPYAHTILHHHTRTQAHIGANTAVLANTGTWVLSDGENKSGPFVSQV
jgi:hypothetical protein